MSWISIDIEADGLFPPNYSMLSIGAVVVDKKLERKFYSTLKPISENYSLESLSVCGFTREETLMFDDPMEVMFSFENWINENSIGKPYFISDNNGFDWQFVNWYFLKYLGRNPFGYNSTNIKSLYQGVKCSMSADFKHLRQTKHTHNALGDAIGNAEALLAISQEYNFGIES